MSRIDELIAEYCPDGVPHVMLSTVASYSTTRVDAAELDETSFVGVDNLVANKGGRVDASYLPNTQRLTAYEPGDILLGNIRPYLKKVWRATNRGGCSGDVLSIRIGTNNGRELDSEFLYYLLSSDAFFAYNMQHAKGAKMPRGNKVAILNFRIPVPPLEVQREIARILDKFTQLEAELEAELEARRRQYEHYREGLLSFDLDSVESVVLADAFETRNGYTPAKSDATNWANGTLPWFRMEDIREKGRVLDCALQMIPAKAVKGGRCFPANSLIFATSATIGEHALVTVPFMSNQRFTAVWPNPEYANRFDVKFLFHYGFVIDDWCRNNTTTSSFASVDMKAFKRLRIPIPPIEDQKRIAGQLDSFDALVNDLSVGLPAELAARRKQYEYYRNKLLTFEEAPE